MSHLFSTPSSRRIGTALTVASLCSAVVPVVLSTPPADAGAPLPELRCDFDGDGRGDLATGAPGEMPNGAVIVNYNRQPGGGGFLIDGAEMIQPNGADGEFARGFGSSLACGDFNGDGVDDLAVGAPGSYGTHANAGDVNVGRFYIFDGARDVGITGAPRWFTQDNGGFGAFADQDKLDKFGAAIVAGDFNGDGNDDLAVGAPGDQDAGVGGSVAILSGPIGMVLDADVLSGSAMPGDNLGTARFGEALGAGKMGAVGGDDLVVGAPGTLHDGEQGRVYVFSDATHLVGVLHASSFGIASADDYEDFGYSLAVGDFNGNGFDGVAIGAPNFMSPNNRVASAGAVFVAAGTINGPVAVLGDAFDQGDVGWVSEPGDRFGHALAAPDLNGDGADDLAIGAPLEDVNGVSDAGAVSVRMATRQPSGITWKKSHTYHQGLNVGDQLEEDDYFGAALAAGWFNAESTDDIVIGAPGEGPDAIWPFAGSNLGRMFIGLGWPSHLGQVWYGQDTLPGMAFGESTVGTGHAGAVFTTGEATGWAFGS